MAYAPYQMTPDQAHRERRRAAVLRALAGAAARSPDPTNLIASFQSGLGGALAAGRQQEAVQAAEAQNQDLMALRRMTAEADLARYQGQQQRDPYGAQPWWMNPQVDPGLRAKAQEDAFYHPERSPAADPYASTQARLKAEYDFLQANPGAARMGIGAAPAPQRAPQMSVWQQRQVQAWMHQHPGSTEDDAVAALTYERPVVIGSEFQARDEFGPLYVVPQGVDPHTAVDMKTGRPYPPMKIPIDRRFGPAGGGDTSTGGVTVTAGGKTYTFPDQQSADQFRAASGAR